MVFVGIQDGVVSYFSLAFFVLPVVTGQGGMTDTWSRMHHGLLPTTAVVDETKCSVSISKKETWCGIDCHGVGLGQGSHGVNWELGGKLGHWHRNNGRNRCLLENLEIHSDIALLSLDLRHNDIGDSGPALVGDVVANCTTLTSLVIWFDGNGIGDEGARSLGAALRKMNHLKHLTITLDFNKISSEGFGYLASSLSWLRGLDSLHLSLKFNNIDGAGAASLGESLTSLSHLKTLHVNLYGNSIKDAGANGMVSSLVYLNGLEELILDLRYNHLTDVGEHDLVVALQKRLKTSSIRITVFPVIVGSRVMNHYSEERRPSFTTKRPAEKFGEQSHQLRTTIPYRSNRHSISHSKTTLSNAFNADFERSPAPRTTYVPAPLIKTEDNHRGKSGGSGLQILALLVVLIAAIVLTRGSDVAAWMSTAQTFVGSLTNSMAQARDYSANFFEEAHTEGIATGETLTVQEPVSQPTFQAEPDLATRVDMAAAKATSAKQGAREVSFDDLLNENLSRLSSADRME